MFVTFGVLDNTDGHTDRQMNRQANEHTQKYYLLAEVHLTSLGEVINMYNRSKYYFQMHNFHELASHFEQNLRLFASECIFNP